MSARSVVLPLTRDAVVTRMSKDEGGNITEAVNFFNSRVGGSATLPVTFDEDELGKTLNARNEVMKLLLAAGWRVEYNKEAEKYEVS